MPTASASHAPKNAAFTAKIRSHMLLAWVYQADMRKYFRNIALISARKTNRFLRFAFRKTGSLPSGILPHDVRQVARNLLRGDPVSPSEIRSQDEPIFTFCILQNEKMVLYPPLPP